MASWLSLNVRLESSIHLLTAVLQEPRRATRPVPLQKEYSSYERYSKRQHRYDEDVRPDHQLYVLLRESMMPRQLCGSST